jgi:glycosyl hydrolase family 113
VRWRRAVLGGFAASMVAGGVALTMLPSPPSPPSQPSPPTAQGSDQQRGFAIPAYTAEGYRSPQAVRYLDEIAATGATWVQVNPTWYQPDAGSARIAASADTPSDASLAEIVSAAHRAGLRVLLKPLLDLAGDGGYRGTIRPPVPATWFASYTAFIVHYADLAARWNVAQLAVGTELAGVSGHRDGWLRVIGTVRERYRGTLLYAANFDEYQRVAFWDAVDLIGIDAYWKVSDRPTTDVDVLRQAWRPIVRDLSALASRTGRRVLFTEAGYTSRRGSTTAPWDWTLRTTPDEAEQAAAYQALLAGLRDQPWWAGVFWWCWDVPPATATDPLGYSPHGKAAEAVVRRWWT